MLYMSVTMKRSLSWAKGVRVCLETVFDYIGVLVSKGDFVLYNVNKYKCVKTLRKSTRSE